MQTIRRVFIASLFFTLTVAVAIWFYPGIQEWFSEFNSTVQGRIGSTAYTEVATGALDIGSALLCTSALFYVAMLIAKKRKSNAPSNALSGSSSPKTATDGKERTRLRLRLLLIPTWFCLQFIRNLFSGMSVVGALEAMTSFESLFFSAVVAVVVVLYANGYESVFGDAKEQKPKSAVETKK